MSSPRTVKCKNCGKLFGEGLTACPSCGATAPISQIDQPYAAEETLFSKIWGRLKAWFFKLAGSIVRQKTLGTPAEKSIKKTVSQTGISRPNPPVPSKKDFGELLQLAKAYEVAKDYSRAIKAADECIKIDKSSVEAFMIRGRCHRLSKDPNCEAAIADFSKVIELDPENATAWRFRGTSRTVMAAGSEEKVKVELWKKALEDFKRAGELQPEEEYIGLDILELEICLGKYREAVGSLGTWWNRIKHPKNRLVCAWLGCLAQILAGRPERKWADLKEFLSQDHTHLSHGDWTVTEIDRHLKYIDQNNLQPDKADSLKTIHQLFMAHFIN